MRRESGQLSLGLAAAFTMILVVFGMVLRSGIITREKMKLQQTSDFAALAAADSQRWALNAIRRRNEAIEKMFDRVQGILTASPAPCAEFVFHGFIAPYETVVKPATSGYLGTTIEGEAMDVGFATGFNACNEGCKGYDAHWRNRVINMYRIYRAKLSAEILTIIVKENEVASEYAFDTFLNPENLPLGLQQTVMKMYGKSATTQMVRSAYDQGRFKDKFVLSLQNKDLRLFDPFSHPNPEFRKFLYMKQTYDWYVAGPPPVMMCTLGLPKPWGASTTGKITKEDDYNTSFFIGADYTPDDSDGLSKLAIFLKESSGNPDLPGKDKLIQGKKVRLFQPRSKMRVWSVARPYGGTYPKAARTISLTDTGKIGDEFKGAKLVGLADKEQLGWTLPIEGVLSQTDAEGRPTESSKYYPEDYLH